MLKCENTTMLDCLLFYLYIQQVFPKNLPNKITLYLDSKRS